MKDTQSIRDQFLINPETNFLNQGSFGACPKPVFEDYQKWQVMLERDSYQFMLNTGPKYLEESKEALAKYVSCDKEDLVYVPNPTTAMNIVIKSLIINEGDEVLTTNQEYGAIDKTWKYYCQKAGAKYVQQNIELPILSKEVFLEQFWKGLTSKTKIVFLSQITSPTALIFPVAEICARAKELGLMIIIDGAHVPGHIPLNIKELAPDVYTGACHKWMLAAKGNSFLYVKKELQDNIDPLIVSWGYDSDQPSGSILHDYHQFNGTKDFSAYLTTPAAIKFMEDNQWKERTKKCRASILHYYPIVAKELNSYTLCPVNNEFLGQMCSFPINTPDPVKLKQALCEEHKIEIPILYTQDKTLLRISFQPYNSDQDIDHLIDAIRQIRSKTGLIG